VAAPLYEIFLERLQDRVAKLTVGNPAENHNLGPVINQAALSSMLRYIEIGKKEGRLIAGGSAPQTAEGGYYLEPTVFSDIPPDGTLAQEEIFGPVLAVIRVADFEEALAVANNTEYGLTGAIYSSDRAKLDRARQDFHVGNLYFNRKCTGAMVGAHPFGGFNMSGTDSKAGGPDYLYLFTQAKSVAEKLPVEAGAGRPRGL
jgi:1-pyrroline-5-carboxylate dehydrogenase